MSAMEQPAFRSGRITCWPVAAQHIGALGHEVHAAEHNVLGVGFCGDLGQLVAVAGEVGEADHFVALVVVAEQHGRRPSWRAPAQSARPSCGREAQGSFRGCNCCAASGETAVRSSRTRFTVFRLQSSSLLWERRTGMLKANTACSGCTDLLRLSALTADRFRKPPSTGLLQAFHNWMRPWPMDSKIQLGKAASTASSVTKMK